VEVGVRPAEGALQHLVEHVEPDVGPDVQTSPDWRLGMLKINTYAEDRRFATARLPKGRTWLRLREDAVGELQKPASQIFEVIEVHASDDFLESPVKFGWVRVRTCHVQNGNWTSQKAQNILVERQGLRYASRQWVTRMTLTILESSSVQ
jgi:hypothetical protein